MRDIIASLLSEGVSVEPHLQPLSGETVVHNSANVDNNSRLDVSAYGFWGGRFERAFFDVRVFNLCAQSNRQATLQSTYRHHEQEKKRQYDQRIRVVEHSTFTPLDLSRASFPGRPGNEAILSTTGGMGRAATTFYRRLAAMLSEKRDVPYSKMIGWIRCRLSFGLLRASIMSVRGARSSANRPANGDHLQTGQQMEHFTSLSNSTQPRVSFSV